MKHVIRAGSDNGRGRRSTTTTSSASATGIQVISFGGADAKQYYDKRTKWLGQRDQGEPPIRPAAEEADQQVIRISPPALPPLRPLRRLLAASRSRAARPVPDMLVICADVLLRNVRLIPGVYSVAWANEVTEYMLY